MVDAEFFDVFKMKFTKGKVFEPDPTGATRQVVISPNRDGMVGSDPKEKYPGNDLHTISRDKDDTKE